MKEMQEYFRNIKGGIIWGEGSHHLGRLLMTRRLGRSIDDLTGWLIHITSGGSFPERIGKGRGVPGTAYQGLIGQVPEKGGGLRHDGSLPLV
jgi:hypothetical protein